MNSCHRKANNTVYFRLLLAALFIFLSLKALAVTPPGTVIRSQAQAWFFDENHVRQQVSSNEVVTLIQSVTGVHLNKSQNQWGEQGLKVTFPHQLVNTGNISAEYQLALSSPSGITGTLHLDKNHTGQTNTASRLSDTVRLKPGESVDLLVEAVVPEADNANIHLTATIDTPECQSIVNPSEQGQCQAINIDTIKKSNGVVYHVSHRLDKEVAYVGDLVQVSVRFDRPGQSSGVNKLKIKDRLSEHLEFIADSAQLCKDHGNTCRSTAPNSTRPLIFDYTKGETSGHGEIRFLVRVTGGVGQTLLNTIDYSTYPKKDGILVTQQTNRIPLKIIGKKVIFNNNEYQPLDEPDDSIKVIFSPNKSTANFVSYVWNRGTQSATYRIFPVRQTNTFPEGSLYCLSNNDQCQNFTSQVAIETPQLAPGEKQAIYLKVQLPKNLHDRTDYKNNYSLELEAVDLSDTAIRDRVQNQLINIIDQSTSIDLTLGHPLNGNVSVPGAGSGLDQQPVTEKTVIPGKTLIIDNLYINNTGTIADSYNLSLESSKGIQVPEGISWHFLDSNNLPVTHTGAIKPGQARAVQLVIQTSEQATPHPQSLIITAVSPVHHVRDSLSITISFTSTHHLQLSPDNRIQAIPGTFVTLAHQLANTGNTNMDNIQLELTGSLKSQKWQSIIYEDMADDGKLSNNDRIIHKGASFSLKKQSVKHLVIKVFIPANALSGKENVIGLKATWNNDNKRTIAEVKDTIVVNRSSVVITKEQTHWDCENVFPTGNTFSKHSFPVKPGSCVIYKLTATNQGAEPANNVIIHGAAPDFTRILKKTNTLPYRETNSRHDMNDIHISGKNISATWSELLPGASISLYFGIRIE
ncbi:hypothetical protein CI610_00245 [invertebrate metagenome]|uniref:DUF11 domain-containing protein n=1 Tax=invertebrate metagenome TaxID=1711999 RepID=A0A2H9TC37_9ZZZZ